MPLFSIITIAIAPIVADVACPTFPSGCRKCGYSSTTATTHRQQRLHRSAVLVDHHNKKISDGRM